MDELVSDTVSKVWGQGTAREVTALEHVSFSVRKAFLEQEMVEMLDTRIK
jgi:hypothetical protein